MEFDFGPQRELRLKLTWITKTLYTYSTVLSVLKSDMVLLASTVCSWYVMSAQVSEWSLNMVSKGNRVSNILGARKPFTLSLRS